MAEVKNLFIKSKMNKDLDDRLLPSGEYRDAQNVMISRSEGSDVGALENVLGNRDIQDFAINPTNAQLKGITNPTGFNDGGAVSITTPGIIATGGSGTGLTINLSVNTLGVMSFVVTDYGTDYTPGDIVNFDPLAVDPVAWAGAPVTGFDSTALDPIDYGGDFSVIGKYFDELNNRIYVFVTNYTDNSTTELTNYSIEPSAVAPYIKEEIISFIGCYQIDTQSYTELVFGKFLNFSKNSPIIGVNLLENLLFWTDNRNQPRKINIESAFSAPSGIIGPTYYTEEQQISVAKYYPYIAPRLWAEEDIGGVMYPQCQLKDKSEEFYPRNIDQPVTTEYDNPTYDADFPGDPDFLKNKFARFSYRFTMSFKSVRIII